MAKLTQIGSTRIQARPCDGLPPREPLGVTVIHGDLSFIRQPLLIGHYRSLRLTGTEAVMNELIGEAMDTAHKLGIYPVAIGTHQVFMNHNTDRDNPWRLPRPQAVIVAGLGEEGKLRAADLLHTVRQAVLAWAQLAIADRTNREFELAATLIGSGGSGIAVGQSAQVIVEAVREANDRLAESNQRIATINEDRRKKNKRPLDEWPTASHIFLVELYLDRAREAWSALKVQASAKAGYNITEVIQTGQAALPRPIDSGYRGADYDFMSAVSGTDELGEAVISYTLDTKRARSEVRAQAGQRDLLRELLRNGWNEAQSSSSIGRALFKLLIPVEMESFLSGSSEMQIELDSGTAGIPWELLDTASEDGKNEPWAIRTKLLRKLRTADFRERTRDAQVEDGILIIGEPRCDLNIYPPLPGARREAEAVYKVLKKSLNEEAVKPLFSFDEKVGPDACEVTLALMARDWRIVHIAGHGEPPAKIGPKPQKPDDPPQKDGPPRGVVLSNGVFLGPKLVRNLRPVPELVFLNCCHLAARNEGQLLPEDTSLLGRPYDRASFAAGVAEELIKLGVRCVIAAGWAVGDAPAEAFATTFYDQLLKGQRFLDAVAEARMAAKNKGGNTWAAYQCYGDPDWRFRRGPGDAQQPAKADADEFATTASPADLEVALQTLAVQTEFQKAPRDEQGKKIRHLEARFGDRWKRLGAVAEAFGRAYAATKDTPAAIRWYSDAIAANDGGASIKAAEQLGNLRVRLAWENVEKLERSARSNGGVGSSEALQAAIEAARAEIDDARKLLESLANSVQTSVERQSLCGSAWKRMALVERIAGQPEKEAAATQRMYERYLQAEELARANKDPELFYPALNRMAAEIIINSGKPGWQGFDPAIVAEVRSNLEAKTKGDPDFWSVAGLVDLRLFEALARRDTPSDSCGKLAAAFPGLQGGYEDLYSRVNSMGMWSSVYDQSRFVLDNYEKSAPLQEEKDAVHQLQNLLQQMANGTRRS